MGGKRPYGVAFSPDGSRLAIGYHDSIAVDVLDAATLGRLFGADAGGMEGDGLQTVAWSVDGSALFAAGGLWSAGGKPVRRWPASGAGSFTDLRLALADNNVTGLRSLPHGRLAFAAADPVLGVLGVNGREKWSRGPTQADYRGQADALAVSANGAQIAFGYEVRGPVTGDVLARRTAAGGRPSFGRADGGSDYGTGAHGRGVEE